MSATSDPIDFRLFTAGNSQGPDAPTYLLLHGIGLSHRSLSRLGRQLNSGGRVLALDLPGFGATRHPDHELSIEHCARGIGMLVDSHHLGPVIAVGHSMGAQIAAELAVQRPDLVEAIVLIGPVTDRPTRFRLAAQLARDCALEPPLTNFMVFFDYLRCGVRWFLKEVDAMVAYEMAPAVRRATVPVLVVRGEGDPIAVQNWCDRLAAGARRGAVVNIRGARHVAPHSHPAAVAEATANFVARLRRTR